jgi:hypothetical protein
LREESDFSVHREEIRKGQSQLNKQGRLLMKSEEFKKNPSFFQELVMFIRHNKKWYLIPVVISILLLGVLIALGSTGAAPFIYTLF